MQNYPLRSRFSEASSLKFKILTFSISIFVFAFLIFNFAQAALVPCGPGVGKACTWCDLYTLADNIINFMVTKVVFPVAAIMVVVGGIFMMTAAGSEKRWTQGKAIATAAIIGIFIALLSYLIIDIIISVTTVKSFGPWNKIECLYK